MRKQNVKRIKRAGALALATVMLAGALTLPASAAADQAYVDDLNRVLCGEMSAQALMEKYPNSPEAVYYYVEENEEELTKNGQLIPYLDRVISLGLQTELPYEAKWSDFGVDGAVLSSTGLAEEGDYTELAAERKAEYESRILGHQEQAINAEQQNLDCWDRWERIRLKYSGQVMEQYRRHLVGLGTLTQKEIEESVAEEQNWRTEDINDTLSQSIPQYRAELDAIRQWYAAGASGSFDVGKYTKRNDTYVHIEGAKGGTNVSVSEISEYWEMGNAIKTAEPILAIQRTLNTMVIFVPEGTDVAVSRIRDYGESEIYYDGIEYYTATGTAVMVANTSYYRVYVVGV